MGRGTCTPRKFSEFRGYEIASSTNFGPIQCFWDAKRPSFTCMNIHPLYLLRHTGPVSALQSLISQATPFCRWSLHDCVWLEEQKEETLGRVLSHSSQPSCKFQHVTCVLNWGPCVGWLSNDVNWQCHASKPRVRRKSGPVETRLTGLVAMALIYDYQTAGITEHSNTERNCVKVWWYHMTVAKIHSTRA